MQEANIEVKNVAEWIGELDEFFKRQREASLLDEEIKESLAPIAEEFHTSVVRPAFRELKQGLEELGKRVECTHSAGAAMDSIRVFGEGDAEEITYTITAEVSDRGITVLQHSRFTSKRDWKQYNFQSSLKPPTGLMSASEIKGLKKEYIIEHFLEAYKEAIGYVK